MDLRIRLPIWLGLLVILSGGSWPMAARGQSDSTAVALLELSLPAHPRLMAVHQEWIAAAQRERRARSWPDPVVTFGYWIDDVRAESGPGKVELMQPVPWFGARSLAGEVQAQVARRAQAELERQALELVAKSIESYSDYAFLARSVEVTRDILEILRYQERIALTRYETGTTIHPDVVRLQIERAELEDRLQRLLERRPAAMAELNVALGRTPESALPWPVPLTDDPAEEEALRDPAAARTAILARSPRLQAAAHETRRADRQLALARREQFPDWSIGVETMFDQRMLPQNEGRTTWMAMVSLNLPLWRGKYDGAIDEAAAGLRAAEHAREDVLRNLLAEAEQWFYRIEEARRRIDLYRNVLIPKGEEALQSTSRLYQTGQVSVLDFLDSERSLLQFQLDLARARADRNTAIAWLRALTGIAPIDLDELFARMSERLSSEGENS